MEPKAELTKEFLKLADDDLRLSELIIDDPEPIYWAAAFHAQQCAEKSLKALLTFHDIRAGKTHDINKLLQLALPALPDLEIFKDKANILTSYAVESRYPVQYADVSKQEAIEAIEIARNIFESILKALPDIVD